MHIDRFVNFATMTLVWIGGLLMLGVIVLTIADVVSRWTLARGYIGLVDVTQFAVVGFAYLALPRVFWTDANVAIELYDDRLSARADAIIRMFALLLSLGIIVLIFRYGFVLAQRTLRYHDVSQNIGIPMIGFWVLILAGLGVSMIIILIRLWQCARVALTRQIPDAR